MTTRRLAVAILALASAAAALGLAPLASTSAGLTWTANRHGQFTWEGAVAAAAAYTGEGSTEWRLPTVAEATGAMIDGSYGATEVINGTINQYTTKAQGQWVTIATATTNSSGVPIASTVTTRKVLKGSWLLCKFVRAS